MDKITEKDLRDEIYLIKLLKRKNRCLYDNNGNLTGLDTRGMTEQEIAEACRHVEPKQLADGEMRCIDHNRSLKKDKPAPKKSLISRFFGFFYARYLINDERK